MNGKMSEDFEAGSTLEDDILNPFIHRLELSTTYDKIKTAIFTVAVLPFRVAAICGLLVVAWCFACIGLYGLNEQDLRTKPMQGWRKKSKLVLCKLVRGMFFFGGFHWLTIKGKQASTKEAPILVMAPHSSYFDSITLISFGAPSPIAKGETGQLPVLGQLINYTQPVYVWREDPDSRQNTIREIVDRATSDLDWPQVLIFPEGTCTNRSCLITFKSGAFYPGVPVQPVCIRYPNKLDTVTWTWEGPGALKLLWLTLTQIHSYCEIEFLPVYRPSTEEKNDPRLFANNVRKVMAKALGVPVSNYTYDDCRLMTRAKQMNLPCAASMVEMQTLRHKLGLTKNNIELELITGTDIRTWGTCCVEREEFAERLGVEPASRPELRQLFTLCDKNSSGVIDFREYLLAVIVISKSGNLPEMLYLIFKVMDEEGDGRITESLFCTVLNQTLSFSQEHSSSIFCHVDREHRGYVTYNEFRAYAQKKKEFSGIFGTNHHLRCKEE